MLKMPRLNRRKKRVTEPKDHLIFYPPGDKRAPQELQAGEQGTGREISTGVGRDRGGHQPIGL